MGLFKGVIFDNPRLDGDNKLSLSLAPIYKYLSILKVSIFNFDLFSTYYELSSYNPFY